VGGSGKTFLEDVDRHHVLLIEDVLRGFGGEGGEEERAASPPNDGQGLSQPRLG